VPEHDALQAWVFPGCDTDQGGEITGVLVDVPHQHPFAARTAVPAVVQRVGDQPGLAETLGNMVVAASMLAETVGQHHDRLRRGIRGPDVVDDPHAADAVEIPFSPGGSHYGQRNGCSRGAGPEALRRLARGELPTRDELAV
jgi:hypothetical protein